MLARFYNNSMGICLEYSTRSNETSRDGDAITVDLDVLQSLILPLPVPSVALRQAAGLCGRTTSSLCRSLQSVIENDVESLARLFSELDPLPVQGSVLEHSGRSAGTALEMTTKSFPSVSKYPVYRPRSSSSPDKSLVILPNHPSAPTIIITPCTTEELDTSCWVPLQDAAFGTRLIVPKRVAHNLSHPPLAVLPDPNGPVKGWKYARGHWCAVMVPLQEQAQRGLFSKVTVIKRRARRAQSPRR